MIWRSLHSLFSRRNLLSAPALVLYAGTLIVVAHSYETTIRRTGLTSVEYTITSEDESAVDLTADVSLPEEMVLGIISFIKTAEGKNISLPTIEGFPDYISADGGAKKTIISFFGEALAKRKRFTEAFSVLDILNDDERIEHGSSFAYAQSLSGLSRDAQAMLAYQKHVDAFPNHQAGHINYGLLLARYKRHDEALVILTRAAEITSGSRRGKALSLSGTPLMALGRYEEAVSAYERSIEYRPTNGPTWRKLAIARASVQSIPSAAVIKTFQQADALSPGSAKTQKAWAQYYFSTGPFYRSAASFSRSHQAIP